MAHSARIFSCAFLALVLSSPAYAGDARTDLVSLVRHLGYGAGIHDYKNYVLRAFTQYHRGARRHFELALGAAARLADAEEFDQTDREALAAVERTVRAYLDALGQIRARRDERRRIEDVDREGKVDDAEAVRALRRLRAKWTWTPFEEVEFVMGFGGAIHDFKNYVLRGDRSYRDGAAAHLADAEARLSSLIASAGTDERQRVALATVRAVVVEYAGLLAAIDEMRRAGRNVRQIDLAVKIDDGPAKAALVVLRASPP